jgi:hypothetical protein
MQTVNINKEELALMEAFILEVVNAPNFLIAVVNEIESQATNSPEDFITPDGEHVEITEEDVEATAKKLLKQRFTMEVPAIIYEYVHENIDWKIINRLEEDIKEMKRESNAFNKDPLGYHGMSEKDFL